MSGYGALMDAPKTHAVHYGPVSITVHNYGRIHKDYSPLIKLVAEWEAVALTRWEASHGK